MFRSRKLNKMLIPLIVSMQNDIDHHNPNGEYLTFNTERGGEIFAMA